MINKTKLTNFAQEYLTNGISILPIKKDKRPVIKWSRYQENLPTMEEVGEWPLTRADGLAWIMGEVSGGMETLDFDFKHGLTVDQYQQFEDTVEEKCPGLGERVLRQKTPTGGRHWIYRCNEIAGNLKLAIGKEGEAIIETRGEGGYICVEPTKDYAFQNWLPNDVIEYKIPEITPEERQVLMSVAKSFSIEPIKDKKKSNKGKMDRKEVPSFPPSFLDYSNDHKMSVLVEEDGWVFLDESTDGKGKPVHRYQRDGGSDVGASLYPEDNTFYVFTTSSGLPTHQMMNCAEYIMYRDFQGDQEATLEWLEEEGYPDEEAATDGDKGVRLKLRLKRDIKEKRFIDNMVHSIKAIVDIRYNVIRQVFECKAESAATYLDGWNGLDSRAVQGKLLACGIKVPYQKVTFVLADDSHWDKVDPVQQWLDNLIWDKVPRINDLANHIRCSDQKRWRNNFKKHLIRCVRQLYLDEVNRYALILHSAEQSNGKSTFIRYIVKAGVMKHYYSEDLPKEGSEFGVARFVSMNAHANMEELDGFGKKDVDHLKALTTREHVSMRKMRTDAMFTVPRRANFWGSTNKAQFLTDTSNTRWIINEVEAIDWEYVSLDISQVWAEAVVLYKGGVPCDLKREEIELNESVADDYKSELFPAELIFEAFDIGEKPGRDEKNPAVFLSATEVLDDLELYYSNKPSVMRLIKNTYTNKFGGVLRGVGFVANSTRTSTVSNKRGFYVLSTKVFEDHKLFVDSHYVRNK